MAQKNTFWSLDPCRECRLPDTVMQIDVIIRFDTTWDCYITVTFEGVTEADFKEKVGQILNSEIKKTEDGFLFTVLDGFAGWIDGCDYESEIGEPYIKCKKIFWQIEIA